MSFSLCSNTNTNVGEILCDVSRGVLKRPFIFNDSFSSSDYADSDTFLAALIAGAKKSKSATGKVFPIPEAQDIADKSEANKEGSLGLGFKTTLIEGKPAYEFKFFAGTTQLKSLRKYNNKTIRIMEYDANGNVWGTKQGTTFIGFKAKLFFVGGKIATGQNVEEGIVTVTVSILDNSEYFDNAHYMPIDTDAEILGLLDVNSTYVSNSTNVHKIKFSVPTSQIGGEINLGDTFGATLASAALFTAGAGTNYGTSLAITTVAYNTATKDYSVTFDSTAYTALAGGTKIKLSPVAPQTLDAADCVGVEIASVILTK